MSRVRLFGALDRLGQSCECIWVHRADFGIEEIMEVRSLNR